jgi:AGZA family xanthine/uracil permease-like MFS transporter
MPSGFFKFKELKTNLRTEIIAGLTTFITMAYIIFVNPQILSFFGDPAMKGIALPISATVTATCLASGLMCILMGLLSNFPLALASGMGLNAIAAYQLAANMGSFKPAFGVFVIEGLVITILVLTRFRESVMRAIPQSLKVAIGVGIGIFIAFIGFQNGGIIVSDKNTLVALGDPTAFPVFLVIVGFILTAVMTARKVPGAILLGILITAVIAITANYIAGVDAKGTGVLGFLPGTAVIPSTFFSAPDFSTFGYVDFSVFSKLGILGATLTIFSVMLSDFFDTMGTVVGVGAKSGLMKKDGKIPGLRMILLVDSLAAAVGGFTGASSVTSYVESTAGIASGGRSGLMPIIVGLLFFLAIFFHPIISVIPAQATAPALILVGFLMTTLIREIDFDKMDEAIPAFMIIIMMPFTYSITNGIGAGFITFTLMKILHGRFREVHPLMYVVTLGFIIYFAIPLLHRIAI